MGEPNDAVYEANRTAALDSAIMQAQIVENEFVRGETGFDYPHPGVEISQNVAKCLRNCEVL